MGTADGVEDMRDIRHLSSLFSSSSYFRGHNKRVVTLCMSPTDESFLSGSLDKTIRLWDLRSANCQVTVLVVVPNEIVS